MICQGWCLDVRLLGMHSFCESCMVLQTTYFVVGTHLVRIHSHISKIALCTSCDITHVYIPGSLLLVAQLYLNETVHELINSVLDSTSWLGLLVQIKVRDLGAGVIPLQPSRCVYVGHKVRVQCGVCSCNDYLYLFC